MKICRPISKRLGRIEFVAAHGNPKKKKKTIIHFENLAPMVCHEFP
jgi:hypothetical protein